MMAAVENRAEEVSETLTWCSAEDEAFMQQRLTWLDGLRPGFNPRHQGVIIFTKKVRLNRWSSHRQTLHSLAIHMDAYGECVYTHDFPAGTHIREAKLHAVSKLHELRARGHEIISD